MPSSRLIPVLILLTNLFLLPHLIFSQSANSYPWLPSHTEYRPLQEQIPTPQGFTRVPVKDGSYAEWLRGLPLYPSGTPVRDYQGKIRVEASDTTLAVVVQYNIRGKKLEQCMDIIQRWWAEYLWSNSRAHELSFIMPGGQTLAWEKWATGYRPAYKGVNISLHLSSGADSTREAFEAYLWEVFYQSFTQTAYVGYPRVDFKDIEIGDFIIKKGRRGHAVLLVDLAKNDTGDLIGLFGHGDTPARNFYILNYRKDQPWFPLSASQQLIPFPFKKKMSWDGLRRFEVHR